MDFKASLDKTTIVITSIVGAILVFFCVFNFREMQQTSNGMVIWISSTLFVVAVFAIAYLYSPKGYRVDNSTLVVRRLVGNKVIPVNDLQSVSALAPESMQNLIRNFGAGGFFGYFGKFSNRHHGLMTLYATQRKNYLMLIMKKGQKIVLTPDDREGMITAIQSLIKNPVA